MNICIVSTCSYTFDEFSALLKETEEDFRESITEYQEVKVNDHKSIMNRNCSVMDAFEVMISSPEMKDWDKENYVFDII